MWDSRAEMVDFRWSKGGGGAVPPSFRQVWGWEISIVKSTLCGGRGWTSREIGVTGSLTPNSKTMPGL